MPRRLTGNSKMLKKWLKNNQKPRHMALIPYIVDTKISLILLTQDHFIITLKGEEA